jgi:insertion element IS1 protein InsB
MEKSEQPLRNTCCNILKFILNFPGENTVINFYKIQGVNMICPECGSTSVVKNGSIHNGKKKFMCNNCGRQYVLNPENKIISQDMWDIVDRLLLERIPISGISRVTGISELWLQKYINIIYENVPKEIKSVTEKGKLTIQCDEMWSFVGNKNNKQWIWLALDQHSKKIVGVYIGSRDRNGAQGLWKSLPPVYRQCAVSYTDFWSAYEKIFPSSRHRAVGKETGKTNYIERLNLTLRQRVSRLVRKTLSFSKKIENHIGAIWYFVHHYNSFIAPKLAITTC